MKAKGNGKKTPHCIYVAALHTIVRAMRDIRIFERFGFNLHKESKRATNKLTISEYDQFEYDPKYMDWVDKEGAELLLGYRPTDELLRLIERIDLFAQ